MALFAAGVSHKNAPVALREQLAVDDDKLRELLRDALAAGVVRGW
jgi:glutamyl-tRNA reductase